jgi:hypothetical protein
VAGAPAATPSLSGGLARGNYDTDYRLQFTTPPYFLRAYGVTPLQLTGTWLTYVH